MKVGLLHFIHPFILCYDTKQMPIEAEQRILMEHVLFVLVTALKRIHGFQFGDSTEEWKKKNWEDFNDRLVKVWSVDSLGGKVLGFILINTFFCMCFSSF